MSGGQVCGTRLQPGRRSSRMLRILTALTALVLCLAQPGDRLHAQSPLGPGDPSAGQDGAHELPRVGVIAPLNLTGVSEYDAVTTRVLDTTLLTLRLIGEYEVVELDLPELLENDAEPPSEGELLELAVERDLANIVFGRLELEDGRLAVEMQVFDTLEEEVVLSERRLAPSLVAVFDATDNLIAEVVEAFSGVAIGFGRLAFENTGEPGRYEVYLDDTPLGEEPEELERVLIGEYEVEVRQRRMLGDETIHSETVEITADERIVVAFAVPRLLESERRVLNELEEELTYEIANPRSEDRVRELFDRAFALLRDLEYSPGLVERREGFQQLEAEWLADIDEWRLAVRPRWIFPVGIGWVFALSDREPIEEPPPFGPAAFAGAARRFGDSVYLGAETVTFLKSMFPVPAPFVAWRPGERDLLLKATIVPAVAFVEDPFIFLKAGVAIERFSLDAIVYADPPWSGANELDLGFAFGYVF